MLCLATQSCLTLCGPLDHSPPGASAHGDSPGKNTGVSGHALLQGILLTQGSNPGCPHCGQMLYCLSHQGTPRTLEWAACPFSRGSPRSRNQTWVSCLAGGFFTGWATREAQQEGSFGIWQKPCRRLMRTSSLSPDDSGFVRASPQRCCCSLHCTHQPAHLLPRQNPFPLQHVLRHFSRGWLSVTPWPITRQAPLLTGLILQAGILQQAVPSFSRTSLACTPSSFKRAACSLWFRGPGL